LSGALPATANGRFLLRNTYCDDVPGIRVDPSPRFYVSEVEIPTLRDVHEWTSRPGRLACGGDQRLPGGPAGNEYSLATDPPVLFRRGGRGRVRVP